VTERGWLIADGGIHPRFRWWDEMGPHWTTDPFKAIRLARRADAEQLCSGDEDAWQILEYEFNGGDAFLVTGRSKVTNLGRLTAGEAAVVTMASAGHVNKAIAARLRISTNAVEKRKQRVKVKMAIGDSVEWMSFLKEFQP
jgi:DNA-binding NarL/FixJ family response regulator